MSLLTEPWFRKAFYVSQTQTTRLVNRVKKLKGGLNFKKKSKKKKIYIYIYMYKYKKLKKDSKEKTK